MHARLHDRAAAPPAAGSRASGARRLLPALTLALLAEAARAQDDVQAVLLSQNGWTWNLGGQLSVNANRYGSDNASDNGLETERASVILQGRGSDGSQVWIEADLDGEDTMYNLWEAWYETPVGEDTWLRAGQQRFALGTEFATRLEHQSLVGYGFTSYLDGRYDTGVAVDGYGGDNFWWQLGGTIGAGFDLEGRPRRDPQLGTRLVLTADRTDDGFEGGYAGFGVAYSFDYDDHIQVSDPLSQTIFTTGNLDAGSACWRHLELGWRGSFFRASFEQVDGRVGEVPVGGGVTQAFDELGSWMASTVFSLRGEPARWERGRWVPVLPPRERQGSINGDDDADAVELPVELAFRYSNADIDRDLFDFGLTSEDPSSQETRSFSAALGAWVDPRARLTLQWTKIIADHELSVFGGTARDSSLTLRLDMRF